MDHSPLPWQSQITGLESRMAICSGSSGRQLATVHDADTHEGRANLHLMLAGPRMLATLKRTYLALREDEGRDWDEELYDIEVAIAQASGRTPPPRPVKKEKRHV